MAADEERSGLQDAAEYNAFEARLKALTEYRALLERRRDGESDPFDRDRAKELQAFLERTGGIPHALRWHRERRQGGEG
jgi:hypothetical protein